MQVAEERIIELTVVGWLAARAVRSPRPGATNSPQERAFRRYPK